jgi:hypothetical protein
LSSLFGIETLKNQAYFRGNLENLFILKRERETLIVEKELGGKITYYIFRQGWQTRQDEEK